jgi:hypothetical protein
MRALRPVFIFLTGIIFSSCLLDLDTFVTPVVFKPETIPIDQPFEFGDFTGGELSEDVNAIPCTVYCCGISPEAAPRFCIVMGIPNISIIIGPGRNFCI